MTPAEKKWIKKFGQHVAKVLKEKGYASPYDFWLQKAGDEISRASINNVISGKKDIRLTTVKRMAKLLDMRISELLEFD